MLQPMKDKTLLSKEFKLSDGRTLNFKTMLGSRFLLYFYPKDSTPGCTVQAIDFTSFRPQFEKLGYKIFGVSRDSVASHDKFICKYNLGIDLIADEDEVLCKAFDVIKEKNMYGKKVLGIERSTFVFNEKLDVVFEWRKVKAEGHAEFILTFLQGK